MMSLEEQCEPSESSFLPESSFQSLLSKPRPLKKKELRRIEAETARLEQQNDTTLAKFLADDWVCVGARTLSKKEFIESVKPNLDTHENGVNPYTIEKKQVKVHVFGDTAVVTLIKEYHQTSDTTKFFAEEGTDVFTRDASGWHLRFTKISPQA
jgi:ketosteroid isomerase-like protein